MRKVVYLAVIFSIFLTSTAQAQIPGAAAGVAGVEILYDIYVHWKEGEARKYYEHTGKRVEDAVMQSLKELKMPIYATKPQQPPKYHRIKGVVPDVKFGDYTISAGHNDRFRIKVIQVETNITRLTIRVNTMGDKPYAELIYKLVDEHLQTVSFIKPSGAKKSFLK